MYGITTPAPSFTVDGFGFLLKELCWVVVVL